MTKKADGHKDLALVHAANSFNLLAVALRALGDERGSGDAESLRQSAIRARDEIADNFPELFGYPESRNEVGGDD